MIPPPHESDWRRFLEDLLQPSVALIRLDGQPVATGFFLSADGLICTAYHAFAVEHCSGGPLRLGVEWQGRTRPAELALARKEYDLAVLRVSAADGPVAAVPVYLGERGDVSTQNACATYGFAGLAHPRLPLRPRLFLGNLGEPFLDGGHERIDLQDLAEGEGNSGAPVLDLETFRVVAHILAAPQGLRRIGDGGSYRHLLQAAEELGRADLPEQWREAGRRFDREAAAYWAQRDGRAAAASLPPGVLPLLADEHNRRMAEDYRLHGTFRPDTYAPREIEEDIGHFLEQEQAPILVIAGLTGSGKTSLLVQLATSSTFPRWQPVLVACRKVEQSDLAQGAARSLGLPGTGTAALEALLARAPDRVWTLLFDGLNEWPGFRLEHWRRAVRDLGRLARSRPNLRVIFAVRIEFLQERLPDLWAPERRSGGPDEPEPELFFHARTGPRRPFLELRCSADPAVKGEESELQRLFERYRTAGFRPRAEFEQLSETVRRMISLPLLLGLFMQRYHKLEVPEAGFRSALLDDVVLPILEQKGEASGILRQDTADLLKGLAGLVLGKGSGLGCLYRDEIKERSWHDRSILETLLATSPILSCTPVEPDDHWIAFRSDWFFEYFLAGYLWDTHFRDSALLPVAAIRQILAQPGNAQMAAHVARAFVILAEWSMGRRPALASLVVHLLNLAEPTGFARGFSQSFLDSLRVHEGFDPLVPAGKGEGTALVRLLDDHADSFTDIGWTCLLEYVEQLEKLGGYGAALQLLSIPVQLWSRLRPGHLSARKSLSQAFNRFHAHEKDAREVDEAFRIASAVEPETLPPDLAAKRQFILGRCLQFQGRYAEASREFAPGSGISSEFGYRCLHQQAFIKMMEDSDFTGAREDLDRIIPNPFLAPEEDLASESRLLHSTCRTLQGDYAAATALQELIAARRRLRRPQKEGMACRALADLHRRRFDRRAALAAVERAFECLQEDRYQLSRAFTHVVHAEILALLDGDIAGAQTEMNRALDLSGQHAPSLSWALQSAALAAALRGDGDEVSRTLDEARRKFTNRHQSLREQFIALLRDALAESRPAPELIQDATALRKACREARCGWYPGVLSLLLMALAGESPPASAEAAAIFGEDVDAEGLTGSALFARIFPSR